ncbi:FAD-dependent oxidoreductase [Pseudaestuariivita rosea]|uniref:FAD-dependent oxidoreductase n=1 Tax=Pseudaestuariivita rosea TaxID=2763263 RepID=UPI001ABA26BB|nr:FAD-dependent oxidoreductase [Pseudaestuariivita rosea]
MPLRGLQVAVVGAGIAGLAVARAMNLRGANVTVFERASAVSEVGAGLQISPNGLAALRALNLSDDLAKVATQAQAVQLCDYKKARPVLRLDLTQLPENQIYSFVLRAELISILLRRAEAAGVVVQTDSPVDQIKPETGEICINGQWHSFGLVIGADGLHSMTRKALNGTLAPFFTRQVAWRALVSATGNPAPQATVYMGPGRHIVTYPLRDMTMMNIVAVEERWDWADEGWSHEDDPDNLRAAFADFTPEIQELLSRVGHVNLWGLFRHPVANVWHGGRAVLLGDAAHPTLPFLAQGANMALEDAWVLTDCLDKAGDLNAGLVQYQALRKPRVSRIVDAATKNARNYHLRWPPVRWAAHSALRLGGRIAPALPLRKFDWLYGHDVTRQKVADV